MNWTRGSRFLSKINKRTDELSVYGWSLYNTATKHPNGSLDPARLHIIRNIQSQRKCIPSMSMEKESLGAGRLNSQENLVSARNVFWRFKLPCSYYANDLWTKQGPKTIYRSYGQRSGSDPYFSRDFLAQLWVADRKFKKARERKRHKPVKYRNQIEDGSSFQNLLGSWFSHGTVAEGKPLKQGQPVFKQPPISQSITGYLEPTSPEEALVAPLLARSNLLITRDIEWANLVLGYEQENRYGIVDVCYPQSPVGFIREQSNVIARQLLRLRRPFIAYITDAMGNELFRVRRPFWWVTSSIYAEIDGKVVGVVHRRWHLWKRIYDLYLGNNQFAVVENPGFWNWTFTLKDIDGQVLAQIDRDWRGFGFEILTDAGQYVIRFGSSDPSFKTGPASMIEELDVIRSLTLSERAVALALAISLDNDYFSRHGGWGIPFLVVGE